jgi:hypothetical protein
VQVIENYGRVRVSDSGENTPLSKVYIKVYARTREGGVQFYKDGYTDHRGLFDYTSLSTDDLDHVDRFAFLVLSEKNGALIKEAAPPKQ